MRTDMFKVIVERPRKRSWKASSIRRNRREFDVDSPSRAAMRAGIGRVFLNENLKPLKRYLEAQVGRPWNKVWSEIAANIDRRNTVQEHIYSHIDDYIAVQVAWRADKMLDLRHPYRRYGDTEWLPQPLYVDPRTGLIRRNPTHRSRIRASRDYWKAKDAEIAARRRPLGNGMWHLLINGEWYEVRLATIPKSRDIEPPDQAVFDVILKKDVRAWLECCDRLKELYGNWNLYAVSRRQLSRREIEEHGLPRSIDVRQTPGR